MILNSLRRLCSNLRRGGSGRVRRPVRHDARRPCVEMLEDRTLPAPWPELQRFDFLVRTRTVEGKELAALQQKVRARAADYLSENHKVAVRVLSELSGQQNVVPTQAAWQRALGAGQVE